MAEKTKKYISVEQRFISDIKRENNKLNKKIEQLKKTIEVFETKIRINQEFLDKQGNKQEPDNPAD